MNSKELLYCKQCGGMIDFSFHLTVLVCPPMYKMSCKDCNSLRIYTETEKALALEELANGRSS